MIIRGSNKATVADLDDQSQAAQVAKRTLVQTRRDILERGWQFNSRVISLPVNIEGRVPVGDYLALSIPDKDLAPQLDEADDSIYVWSHKKNVNTWHDATILDVTVVFDLVDDTHFASIPKLLAEWIAHKAAADFWTESHDGATNQKLEAVAVRRQSRWLNTQPHGNLNDVSGFTTLAVTGGGGSSTFDPRTQSVR